MSGPVPGATGAGDAGADDAGADTKVCPYCAETIKAAAVKCRYCQSDLTEPAPPSPAGAAQPATTAPPPRASAPPPTTSASPPTTARAAPPPTARSGRSWRAPLPLAVAVLLVLALVAGGFAWYYADERADLQEAHDAATSAQVSVKDYVETALSYDWRRLEKDRAAAEKILTDDFQGEYADVVDDVRAEAEKTRTRVQATVVASAVVDAEPDRVELLVFVNQRTQRRDLDDPRVDQNRVVVTMERTDGDWRIDDLEAL